MNRRTFLHRSLAAGLGFSLLPAKITAQSLNNLQITDLQIWRFRGKRKYTSGLHGQYQAQPLHIYDEHRPSVYQDAENPKIREVGYSANYLQILTNTDLHGWYGPVDTAAAVVVDRQLKRFLIGKDPLAVEKLWDQMYRSNRHSRAGHFMMGISAVDNALWDLRGHYYNAPVYQLLGGPTRNQIAAYGSCLGFSAQPEPAKSKSAELKKQGFVNQKWFLPYGPGSGHEGMIRNVQLVKNLRESLGEDADIMFDAFMGWDLTYAMEWASKVEQYHPRWIEEAFHPEKVDSFAQLSRETTIPVATGEHFYNRWEVQRFLEADAIHVVQADPEWCGGVSELLKICTLASAHDVHVIPHGHNIHSALHVVASQSPMTCPMVEYLINKMSYYYMFELQNLTPVNGFIPLTDKPGFGIEFDESKIEEREQISWQ
jgi:L-alanine-DL-glutamate epimerase-like enolase superfamily enzyme